MILATDVNIWVFGFFIINTILLAYLASVYLKQKSKTFKLFGLGLGLNAIAFLFWSYITGVQPENLAPITGLGVVFFIAAFAAFFASSVTALKPEARKRAYIAAGLFLALLVVLRFVFFTSNPGFSSDGFFSFNTNQIVLYAYVITMSFTIMPAAYVIADKVKNTVLKNSIRFGFTLIVIGTAILITSTDNYLQMINGIGMVAAFLLLAISHTVYKFNAK